MRCFFFLFVKLLFLKKSHYLIIFSISTIFFIMKFSFKIKAFFKFDFLNKIIKLKVHAKHAMDKILIAMHFNKVYSGN